MLNHRNFCAHLSQNAEDEFWKEDDFLPIIIKYGLSCGAWALWDSGSWFQGEIDLAILVSHSLRKWKEKPSRRGFCSQNPSCSISLLSTAFYNFFLGYFIAHSFKMFSERSANKIRSLKRKYNVPVWFGLLGFLILIFGIFLWKSFPAGGFKGVSAHLNCFMLILQLT